MCKSRQGFFERRYRRGRVCYHGRFLGLRLEIEPRLGDVVECLGKQKMKSQPDYSISMEAGSVWRECVEWLNKGD